jgi:hypothetical protein
LQVAAFLGSIFKAVENRSLLVRPVLGRSSHTKIFSYFRHHQVSTTHVSYFENPIVFNVDIVRNEVLMNISSFVNVIQPNCYLQEAVHEALRVQVFVFIAEEALLDEVSESFSLEFF